MIFDTHAHYDDEAFDEDRDELLLSMEENGIGTIIDVASTVKSLDAVQALTEKYSFVYGAYGLHPDEVGDLSDKVFSRIEVLCDDEKCVAVGEIGLDYYWDRENHERQISCFERQLELAREKKLPFILHSREAAADTMDTLKRLHAGEIGGVVHCYSYSKEIARECLDMGLYLGIGGVLTFPNAKKLKEVAAFAPMQALLLETDCPYLAPVPHRGKRNNSTYLHAVVRELAQIKGLPEKEIISVTRQNAERLFFDTKHLCL